MKIIASGVESRKIVVCLRYIRKRLHNDVKLFINAINNVESEELSNETSNN